jgi:trk system potassium uptake protein TrkA
MHIVIVGCGTLGSQLAETLARKGASIAVIDPDPTAFRRLKPRFPGKKIEGLGFDRAILMDAGAMRADALATVTSDDNTNFLVASVAREEFAIPKVVARIIDPIRAEVYQHLGVPVIAPTTWGAKRVNELLVEERVATLLTAGNGEVKVVEFQTPHRLVGRMIKDLQSPGEIGVICLIRQGKAFVPLMGTTLEENDLIQAVASENAMSKLESMVD